MMSVDDEKGDIYIGVTFYSNSMVRCIVLTVTVTL